MDRGERGGAREDSRAIVVSKRADENARLFGESLITRNMCLPCRRQKGLKRDEARSRRPFTRRSARADVDACEL